MIVVLILYVLYQLSFEVHIYRKEWNNHHKAVRIGMLLAILWSITSLAMLARMLSLKDAS